MNVRFDSAGTLYGGMANRRTQGQAQTSGQKTFEYNAEEVKKHFAEFVKQWDSGAYSNSKETGGSNVTLSNDDVKDLSNKYNPSNMTQMEYDNFLDDLFEKEVINENDLNTLGHSEHHISMSLVNLDEIRNGGYLANNADLPSAGWQPGFAYGQKRVDVLAMAQYEKSFQYYDTKQNRWRQSIKAAAYNKIYDVLYAMSMYR